MPKITLEDLGRSILVPPGANLRESLLDAGVTVYPFVNAILNCRGRGLCGTCRVKVASGEENLTPRTAAILLDQYHGAFGQALARALAACFSHDTSGLAKVLDDVAFLVTRCHETFVAEFPPFLQGLGFSGVTRNRVGV